MHLCTHFHQQSTVLDIFISNNFINLDDFLYQLETKAKLLLKAIMKLFNQSCFELVLD